MEHESHHHHHPHGTGVRWLDISLAIAAAVVSLVSLWLGLHSAHSMDRLVAANSYPYLDLARNRLMDTPSGDGTARKRVEFMFMNNGIGPARIEWVELTYQGKPVADLTELLSACCNVSTNAELPMNKRGAVANTLVRPGNMLSMFKADEPTVPNPAFDAFYRAMDHMSYSTCYCSVFDECYIRREDGRKPEPVEQCTAPKVPFQPKFTRT